MSAKIAMLLPFAAMAVAQLRPTNPQPTNVEFSEGEIGAVPPGWNVPRFVLDAGYQVQLRRQECRERFSSCIVYLPPPVIRDVRAAELYQTFPAAPYLEK